MTDKQLEMLKWLLEDLETDEGVCYKTRSSTCATACPLWYAGAFGDNICLPSVLGRRITAACAAWTSSVRSLWSAVTRTSSAMCRRLTS